jgi:hypothetical protein
MDSSTLSSRHPDVGRNPHKPRLVHRRRDTVAGHNNLPDQSIRGCTRGPRVPRDLWLLNRPLRQHVQSALSANPGGWLRHRAAARGCHLCGVWRDAQDPRDKTLVSCQRVTWVPPRRFALHPTAHAPSESRTVGSGSTTADISASALHPQLQPKAPPGPKSRSHVN